MVPSGCCIQYVSKSGRLSSGHRTGKGQSSSQFPRRVVLKNVLAIRQLHSSSMLVTSSLKSCMPGFSIMQTKNFQMSKLSLEKEEKPEIKLTTFAGSQRNQRNFRKTSTSVLSTTPKPMTVFSSVVQSRPTLCDPSDFSMSGFPVHHQLLELAQTQVH